MTLKEKIYDDLKIAMKSRNEARVRILRMVVSAIKYFLVGKKEITDEEVIALMIKELKNREDAYGEYTKAGRQDLADAEASDIAILKEYLPKPLSDEELKRLISETIEEVVADTTAKNGAQSPLEMGKVMSKLMPKVKGKADGKVIHALVKELLASMKNE